MAEPTKHAGMPRARTYTLKDVRFWEKLEKEGKLWARRRRLLNHWRALKAVKPSMRQMVIIPGQRLEPPKP